MKKINLWVLSAMLSCTFLTAQPFTGDIPMASALDIGVSEEKLELLDAHIQKFIAEGHLPGGVFTIARKGKVFYNKSFGSRDGESPYKNDDIFRLASMTKAFTTVSIMQLVERGKLRLDDPIFYYLPEFRTAVVAEDLSELDSSYTTRPVNRQISIRHLLTHTSGITYGVFQGGAMQHMYEQFGANGFGLSHDSLTTREMANTIAKVPLIFEPGTEYSYGLNMEVLGAIVEVVSGQTFSAYVSENILDPLGLEDTHFYLDKSKANRVVPVYTMDEDRKVILADDPNLDYPTAENRNHFAGGGGMSGTASDYLVFIQCLLDNGEYNGTRILSRKSIDVMTSDQMIRINSKNKGYSDTPGITYGLGFALITEQGRGNSYKSPGTFEWGGYFNTKFFIDPEEELVFVGMTQIVPFARGDFWGKLYAILYSALD